MNNVYAGVSAGAEADYSVFGRNGLFRCSEKADGVSVLQN
jgi:hypothetical protein